jgi:hypothetical protein
MKHQCSASRRGNRSARWAARWARPRVLVPAEPRPAPSDASGRVSEPTAAPRLTRRGNISVLECWGPIPWPAVTRPVRHVTYLGAPALLAAPRALLR